MLDRALAAPAVAEEATDPTTERILEAALAQFEDFGIRRTTMDDVARRLGMSRVTIYRRFAQKDRLVEAVLMRELSGFLADLETAVAACEAPEERLAEGFAFALSALRGHGLLNRVLRTEPETLLPHLTREGGPVLAAGRDFLAEQIRRELGAGTLPAAQAQAVAELVSRLVLSFLLTPDSAIPLDTPADMRAFARRNLAPIIAQPARRRALADGARAKRGGR
jgi:AcrR family transcriptional regulator